MNSDRTKVDWCFSQKSKDIGFWYYTKEKITNISKLGNKYSAQIADYNVEVLFSSITKDEIDDVECQCSYYENEDNYCPHVYALVCAASNIKKENINFDINYINKYTKLNQKQIKEQFNKKNIDMIDLDLLGFKYEDLFEEQTEPIFDYLDEYIESMPMEVLQQARLKTIKENGDTSYLIKQYKTKKEKKIPKNGISVFNLFSLKNNKNKKINNNSYEPYQFEEEELEEDDYYYEDLD